MDWTLTELLPPPPPMQSNKKLKNANTNATLIVGIIVIIGVDKNEW